MADIIGLYMKPPQRAACSVWMRRVLFRRWTVWIPCCHHRPAGQNGMDFEYYRHGTLSLYAALEVRTGSSLRSRGLPVGHCGLHPRLTSTFQT